MTSIPVPTRNRLIGLSLVIGGLSIPALAVAAELVSAGDSGGFGLFQTMGSLFGLAVAAHGLALGSATAGASALDIRSLFAAARIRNLLRFGVVLAELLLFGLVARTFQLENPAFYQQVVPLMVFGFVVHHTLPLAYRLPFFVALSLGGLLLVLGGANAAWVVAIVLAFVGISRLPIRFGLRLLMVISLGFALAVLRGSSTTLFSAGIWPVLGSILMFRLIVYMYDLRHASRPPTIGQTLAYFFLLPNVVFPLFPVVDFATFCRTHYDRDPLEIYQQGLRWMLRGVTHLLVYRLIYRELTLAPADVSTTTDLVQFLLSTFGLYLRVSGQFHVIVGILHLFGFRLPETHHLFYLSSSFTDFWRRINIYWKDFMMKLVFYPIYFPVRKKVGDTGALVLGTAAVFAITWMTHSYQWFWILGSWLLSWTDGLFWGFLGVVLVFGSLREMKKGRVRAASISGWNTAHAARLAFGTILTFTIICVLWSLWGSETLGEWLDLMSVRPPTGGEWLLIAGVLALVGASAILADYLERRRGPPARQTPFQLKSALATAIGFYGLYLAGTPTVVAALDSRVQETLLGLRLPELNRRDAAQMQRGYYENLTDVGNQNSQLWELYAQRGGQDMFREDVLRDRNDFLAKEMRPLLAVFLGGVPFRTNRWGMRDHDYEQLPPPGTQRIALMGQSYVAGQGVADDASFEQIVEGRLAQRTGVPRTEILNFAVGYYSLPQQLVILPRVLSFRPQTVILFSHSIDGERAALHLVTQLRRGFAPPFEYLRGVLDRAKVDGSLREAEAMSRLKPYRDSIVDFTYAEILKQIRQAGATPIWVYLTLPEPGTTEAEILQFVDRARSAGFAVLNWSDAYDGHDLRTLQVSPFDFHPNTLGHLLIAERMERDLLRLGF